MAAGRTGGARAIDGGDASDEAAAAPPRARRRLPIRRLLFALLAVLLLALALVWSQRNQIAQGLVDRELARRGVEARFRVTRIGPFAQRIEDVRIGNPAAPDLTADWVELRIRLGLNGPVLTGARAGGVRMRGRLDGGRVRFGAVDRLLPPPSGAPFTLPDFDVDLADARLLLATPAGAVRLRLDGRGNLSDGFAGRLLAGAPMLAAGGCRLQGVVAVVGVTVRGRQPEVDGPLRLRAARCGAGLRVDSATVQLDAIATERFDRWRGVAAFDVAGAAAPAGQLSAARGEVTFEGGPAATAGELRVALGSARGAGIVGSGIVLEGDYALGSRTTVDGRAAVADAALGSGLLARLGGWRGAAAGTPVAPLVDSIVAAAERAGRGFGGNATFAYLDDGGARTLRVSGLETRSRSGAVATLADGDGLVLGWPTGAARVDGRLALRGGGMPTLVATLRQPRAAAPITGVARIEPYATGDARLTLAPVRFSTGGGSLTRVSTAIDLDGSFAGGRVEGLRAALSARLGPGGVALDPGCVDASFRTLAVQTLTLDPAEVRLCPVGRATLLDRRGLSAMRIDDPALSGRIGSTPVAFRADAARLLPAGRGFAIDDFAVRFGAEDGGTLIAGGAMAGAFADGGAGGRFEDVRARIGTVPLLIGDAAGDWRFEGSTLSLAGAIGLTDAAADPRFERLVSNDARLTLAGGTIRATATLRAPATGRQVLTTRIEHRLGEGAGEAAILADVRFDEGLQPDALTRLTVGVIADVTANVTGEGEVRWTPAGVTSTGAFRTRDAALAAAFGPVAGLTTEVRFTDLLALESAPGQSAAVGSVNPGIEILDGALRYQLLAGQRVQVEGGSWPLAGGTLTLQPTLLDFSQASERRLTFDVNALDAARFIGRFGFTDFAATGVFDGRLPIVFDEEGGRIEDGALASRTGGGTLAYNGQVSDANLGTWGKLAFDALRSIRYDGLTIGLDGAIDGEMVTQVRFAGVNRETALTRANFLLRQFTNLPFIFNITLRAPFRGLLASLRGFSDPEELLRRQLPDALNEPEEAPAVQTPVSRPGS